MNLTNRAKILSSDLVIITMFELPRAYENMELALLVLAGRLYQALQAVRLPNHRKTISVLISHKSKQYLSHCLSPWFWSLFLLWCWSHGSFKLLYFPKWSKFSELLFVPPPEFLMHWWCSLVWIIFICKINLPKN